MAAQTQTTKTHRDSEAAADRIRELNEQVLDFGRKAGLSVIEGYENGLKTWAEYQDKVADSSQVEWVANAARAQANFTREISRVYTSSARDLLK